MLTCLVLGMGIPTIPNYIITSSLAGPARRARYLWRADWLGEFNRNESCESGLNDNESQ